MPVYTYRCENCGFQFDRYQKFADQPLSRCPECSKKSLRKVYSPVGIVFKGSGFYSTDNRSPSGAPRAGTNRDNEKSSESEKSSTESTSTPKSEPAPTPKDEKE